MKRILLFCMTAVLFTISILHAENKGTNWKNAEYIGKGEEFIVQHFGDPDRVVLSKQIYILLKKGVNPQAFTYEYVGSPMNPFFRDVPIISEGAYGYVTGFIGFEYGKVRYYGYRVNLFGNCVDNKNAVVKTLETLLGKPTARPTAVATIHLYEFDNSYELGFTCPLSSNSLEVTLTKREK